MSSATAASGDRRSVTWDGHAPEALASAWGVPHVEAWERIGSTNDRAAALAREGVAGGTVVVADEQTAGRGRRGRPWSDPDGNLAMAQALAAWIRGGLAAEE